MCTDEVEHFQHHMLCSCSSSFPAGELEGLGLALVRVGSAALQAGALYGIAMPSCNISPVPMQMPAC